jgi:hypothetical protein
MHLVWETEAFQEWGEKLKGGEDLKKKKKKKKKNLRTNRAKERAQALSLPF